MREKKRINETKMYKLKKKDKKNLGNFHNIKTLSVFLSFNFVEVLIYK